ncbi:MAG: hypothetical protein AAFQ19_09285 [Pseudomonadota bacterium]
MKFTDCRLGYNLNREETPNVEIEARLEFSIAPDTWSWLAGRPFADCDTIPLAELEKLSCPDPNAADQLMATDAVKDLKRWRELLAGRLGALETQRAALDRATGDLAGPELVSELEALNMLENRLSLHASKVALMQRLSDGIEADPFGAMALQDISFQIVRQRAQLSSRDGFSRASLGSVSEGDVVIVLDRVDARGEVKIMHARLGDGYISADVLAELDEI